MYNELGIFTMASIVLYDSALTLKNFKNGA